MRKKLILSIISLYITFIGYAQESAHNFGNLKIHEAGALGFHHDLINNGSFDENLGLVGFFNNDNLTISGAFRPIFNDIEVMVEENLYLDIGIGINRHFNFIDGTIVTPRNSLDINTDFIEEAFYSGDGRDAKVDGYAVMTAKDKFRFPIGDEDRIRPLLLETEGDSIIAKSAYFFENPNTPSTFNESFDTTVHGDSVAYVNDVEFWHLEGDTNGRIELLWDDRTDIKTFVDDVENLGIVGWHNTNKEWNFLGLSARKGDLDSGRMVSDYFNMSDYSIITFGGISGETDLFLTNYLLTLNNDGVNDFLVIKAVEDSPNNLLKIFNRWGRSVYIEENYRNGFNGKTNTGVVLRKGKILPVGLYFYVIELKDLDKIHQGYLYINE